MPEGFTLYEKGAPSSSTAGRPGRPGSALPRRTAGNQSGSGARPQSAGVGRGKGGGNIHGAIAKQNTKNAGRAAAMKAYYGDNANDGDHLGLMSKEALMLEVNELKKKNKLLEKQSGQVKAENQRLENEIKQQQQRIDRLMDPAAAARSGVSANSTRKEVEKSLLVRHLKQQMMQLRVTIAEKDNELESAMRSAKMSNITELITEREEYYFECRRLKGIIKNLKGELAVVKRAKKGNNEEVELELRKEVARLAAGYQDILGTIREKEFFKQGGSGKSPQQQQEQQRQSPRQAFGTEELPSEGGVESSVDKAAASPAKGGTGRPQLDIVGGPSPTKKEGAASPKKELPFKIGDRVEGQFQGQGSWYPATVKYITGPHTLHLAYDDGDEEPNAKLDNVRALPRKDGAPASQAAAPPGTGASPAPEEENEEYEEYQEPEEEEKEGAGSKFKVGDAVEALYYNGSTWYPAKIGASHSVAGQWHYDLDYDDGDREMKVHESKIKLKSGPAPAPAAAPAAVPVAASKPKAGKKEGKQTGEGAAGLEALLGLSPEKDLGELQKEYRDRRSPRDYSNPSSLALDLRTRTKRILRGGYREYRKAFASMCGSAGDNGLQHDTCATVRDFKPFVEDVLERVLPSSGVADLYDEVARGAAELSFAAFVLFMEEESADTLRDREEAAERERERERLEAEAAARQKQERDQEREREEEERRKREREQAQAQALERARKDEEERRLADEKERKEAADREAAQLQRKLEEEERRAAELRRRVEEQEREAAAEEERERLRKERDAAAAAAEAEVESDGDDDNYLNNLLAEPSDASGDGEVVDDTSKPSRTNEYEGDFEEVTPRYNDDFEA